ncbi:hypothetical protein EVAR_35905_1 [Eumeta japonica]|uniref:Uncharacterized protein n=1 Tax=Eumeta variegata TaxID=151549 RepID=A0A4C1WUS2_EUMVA|nr:hypothetical protein EVAR_35905_1 [Eumeta japonica]
MTNYVTKAALPDFDLETLLMTSPYHYAPSTITNRPFPEPPSSMTEGPVNDEQLTVSIATTVTAKKAVAESSTQSVMSEIDTERSTTPLPNSNVLEKGSAHLLGENHLVPAASLTSFQTRPIPTMAAPKTDRKHKRRKSEVLTSTPVKAEQALKFQKANNKRTKIFIKCRRMSSGWTDWEEIFYEYSNGSLDDFKTQMDPVGGAAVDISLTAFPGRTTSAGTASIAYLTFKLVADHLYIG